MEASVEAARKSPRSAVKVDGKTPRKKKQKVLAFEFDEEDDVKTPTKSSKRAQSEDDDDDEEDEDEDEDEEDEDEEDEDEDEEVPISQLKKKRRKSAETESDSVLGFRAEDEMVAAAVDDDLLMTPFQTQETDDCEAQERRVKPRAASTLPIVFGEKVNKSKVLLECEGDTVDLSGDMGAVGRFNVDRNQELSLDLKGIIYKTIIVPSNTFFVVNVGQTEAKVECIMSDFVQLQADTNCNENETMVEGTLKDFGFDSDEEREHLAINGGDKAAADTTEKVKHEEGADNGEQPKKKEKATKAPKSSKAPAKKATVGKPKVRVASAKGVGKKSKAIKTKAAKK